MITNPTPDAHRVSVFSSSDLPGVDQSAEAVHELRRADLIVVLDISDLARLGMLDERSATAGCPWPAWTTT